MTAEPEIAFVIRLEKHWFFWTYSVDRPYSWWTDPAHGIPTRADSRRGFALTSGGALAKAHRTSLVGACISQEQG